MALEQTYSLNKSLNSEIQLRWYSLCIRSEADWVIPYVVKFITSQGRMKFVRPLYRALHNSVIGSGTARQTFIRYNEMLVLSALNRAIVFSFNISLFHTRYHPIARKMVAQDIGVDLSKRDTFVVDSTPVQVPDVKPTEVTEKETRKAVQSSTAAESSSWVTPAVIGAVAVAAAVGIYLARKK